MQSFKFIILALDSAYEAFKSFGRDVYEALQPVIDGLLYIYDLVKSILTTVGKGFASEVNKSWAQTFGKKTEIEPEDRASQNQNHFRTVKRSIKEPAAKTSGNNLYFLGTISKIHMDARYIATRRSTQADTCVFSGLSTKPYAPKVTIRKMRTSTK